MPEKKEESNKTTSDIKCECRIKREEEREATEERGGYRLEEGLPHT